jgi:hypothetical protein
MKTKGPISKFARRLLNDLADPNSRQAQMVEDLREFYRQMSGNAIQTFEGRLREFTEEPDAHLGFIDEADFANLLRARNIPHCFVPKATDPTPDIEAMILNNKIYFEIKAVQEDRYKSFIDDVLEQLGEVPSQYQMMVIPVYMGQVKTASLVAKVVQEIRNKLATGDYSPIQYDGKDASIHIRFECKPKPSVYSWRFTWPESRVVCGIPYLEYKLEKTLRKNIEQFKTYKPTFLVWYTWDQSLWDSATQFDFLASTSRILKQTDFVDVAGIIIAAPSWFVSENQSFQYYQDLKCIGLFDAIRALK